MVIFTDFKIEKPKYNKPILLKLKLKPFENDIPVCRDAFHYTTGELYKKPRSEHLEYELPKKYRNNWEIVGWSYIE